MIIEKACAGTNNKRDCLVCIDKGNEIIVRGKSANLFEEHIKKIIEERLDEIGIEAKVEIEENGALDYVIIARLEAAISKATGNDIIDKKVRRGKTAKDRIRRSRLYLPGNNPRYLNSIPVYEGDAVILDLEDSVALDYKVDARYLVKNALKYLDFGKSEIWVRINKEMANEDIKQISYGMPHGLCIPKVENEGDIQVIERIMEEIGVDFHLMPIIETAKGIANAREIALSSEKIVALAFGAEDYTRDVGAKKKWETLLYPRFSILLAAKAAGIQALDTVYTDIEDEDGLREETKKIVEMGFDGKGAIHPGQIEIIHECFEPTKEEIKEAKKIIEAIEEAKKKGLGVASLDGKMIDLPVEKKARRILKMASYYG